MEIKKYFRKQTFAYWLNMLLPFILWMETAWLFVTSDSDSAGIMISLTVAALMIEAVLILFQAISQHRFWKTVRGLSESEKMAMVTNSLKVGKILVNEQYIFEYGMFHKRMIPIHDVFRARYQESYTKGNSVTYRVGLGSKKMTLIRKGKKQIVINMPDTFSGQNEQVAAFVNAVLDGKPTQSYTKEPCNEYQGDFPAYGIFLPILLGMTYLLVRFQNQVVDWFIAEQNAIEVFLFHVGYERYFQIGSIIYIAVCAVGMCIWKVWRYGLKTSSVLGKLTLPLLVSFLFEYCNKYLLW